MRTTDRAREFFALYTRGFTTADFQRLFTHDTRDAYRFFARHIDEDTLGALPPAKRFVVRVRLFFMAFALKLSPARRVLFAIALVTALIGLVRADGTLWLLGGFVLVNLLVLLEVADRLTLKNDLEVARDIQLAMLPQHTYAAAGVEAAGRTRPANTVGGDFYDIQPLADGRLLVAQGDVAGKGSPAALLMALLLAMLRTLASENLPPAMLVERLNRLVHDQTPGSRFITLFLVVFDPRSGDMIYVNAGHTPPLLHHGRTLERLTTGGMALGMFEGARYDVDRRVLDVGDLLLMYSDGITEAEDPGGRPFDEQGLRSVLTANLTVGVEQLGKVIFSTVERFAGSTKLADDLTVLAVRRVAAPAPATPTT